MVVCRTLGKRKRRVVGVLVNFANALGIFEYVLDTFSNKKRVLSTEAKRVSKLFVSYRTLAK